MIHGLRPFKYKNTCELCNNILDKDNKCRLTAKKCFVLNEEVIDVFHEKITFPQYKNCHFILLMKGLLVQWNVEGIEMIVSALMNQKTI